LLYAAINPDRRALFGYCLYIVHTPKLLYSRPWVWLIFNHSIVREAHISKIREPAIRRKRLPAQFERYILKQPSAVAHFVWSGLPGGSKILGTRFGMKMLSVPEPDVLAIGTGQLFVDVRDIVKVFERVTCVSFTVAGCAT